MTKRTSTRLYFGAFAVWLIAFAMFMAMAVVNRSSSSPPPSAMVALAVMAVAGIVMLVGWIATLIRLAQLAAWGWFAAVLVSHLVGLGIVGMIAYAVAGPSEGVTTTARPSVA